MWWRVAIEVVVCLVIGGLGASFWSLVFAKRHLCEMLSSTTELQRLIAYIGEEQLLQEAAQIQPYRGSFEHNITLLGTANAAANKMTRRHIAITCIMLMAATYFLGYGYLACSAVCFLTVSAMGVHASTKNQNATHVHELLTVIRRWHECFPPECERFCREASPSLRHLHTIAVAI